MVPEAVFMTIKENRCLEKAVESGELYLPFDTAFTADNVKFGHNGILHFEEKS